MHEVPSNGWIKVWTKCAECKGTGNIEGVTCTACEGSREKFVPVTISALVAEIAKQVKAQLDREFRRDLS